MRECFCGARADFICHECGMRSCWFHVFTKREAWGLRCRASPEHNHAFLLFVQEEQVKNSQEVTFMTITNDKEAADEGRKLGMALAALSAGPGAAGFVEAVNYLGRKFARWEGLQNVDMAFSYVTGVVIGATTDPGPKKQIGSPVGEA